MPGLAMVTPVDGWWTPTNSAEIDIIGTDRSPVASTIAYAVTIKWRDAAPLDQADLNQLSADISKVPGADAGTSSTPCHVGT